MSSSPIVVKLGGDALASPALIAAQARRLASRASAGPVVAVVSARRGVTDHLLGLVDEVRRETGGRGTASAEADRAVAAGEVVSAALLSLALEEIGVRAISLDSQEAGVYSDGRAGSGAIASVATHRLSELLREGVLPVITGFQGWHKGRVTTLGRGGSDTSAVAVAVALGASRCDFVKQTHGLLSADPKLVPDPVALRLAPHRFLTELARAGAKVIHRDAAVTAEQHRLPLAFVPLEQDTELTRVGPEGDSSSCFGVAARDAGDHLSLVTAVVSDAASALLTTAELLQALGIAGVEVVRTTRTTTTESILVPARQAGAAAAALHSALRSILQEAAEPLSRAG